MTTFPNAPASHSALFDNVPAAIPRLVDVPGSDGDVTIEFDTPADRAEFLRRVAHLTPATRISQGRNGQWYALDVLMQYGQPVPLNRALQRAAIGRTVFVRREDAAAVLGAANGADG